MQARTKVSPKRHSRYAINKTLAKLSAQIDSAILTAFARGHKAGTRAGYAEAKYIASQAKAKTKV
ncbi:MAG: hypothetical protein WAL71_11385 [Terriglobales bacterium]|jgi:hypothetical protein